MKIFSFAFGTIVFSIGIFFFNLTSGQNLPTSNQTFMTIVFEDISIVISIVTVYLVFKNTFEDSHNYLNWCVILNVLGAFSALFISTFYQNSPGIISLNNYLILLSYLLFLILVFLTLFVHKQKQIEAKQKKKVIPLTQK